MAGNGMITEQLTVGQEALGDSTPHVNGLCLTADNFTSSTGAIDDHSIVHADTSGNIALSLPDPTTVEGGFIRLLRLKWIMSLLSLEV